MYELMAICWANLVLLGLTAANASYAFSPNLIACKVSDWRDRVCLGGAS